METDQRTRSMRTLVWSSLAALALTAGGTASALDDPDPSLPALNAGFTLEAGFFNKKAEFEAGGPIVVAPDPSHGCPVRATQAATTSVEVGPNPPPGFELLARGSTPPAMLVITPDGDWRCTSAGVGDPAHLRFGAVQSGTYQVWISTAEQPDPASFTLDINEVEVRGGGVNAVPIFPISAGQADISTRVERRIRFAPTTQCTDQIGGGRPPSAIFDISPEAGADTFNGLIFAGGPEFLGLIIQTPTGEVICQAADSASSVGTARTLVNRPAGAYRIYIAARYQSDFTLVWMNP